MNNFVITKSRASEKPLLFRVSSLKFDLVIRMRISLISFLSGYNEIVLPPASSIFWCKCRCFLADLSEILGHYKIYSVDVRVALNV